MKVAIIGGGISGLMLAEQLQGTVDYTLYEHHGRLGGHSDTHRVTVAGQAVQVDTGFIVFNRAAYPHFNAMLERHGVASEPSDMSFAVSNRISGLEYNATRLNTLFCQRRNLLKPSFLRMVGDIVRFYRAAPALLQQGSDQTLGEYLQEKRYSRAFIEDHIVPMTSALWSGDFSTVERFPLRYLLAFMHNHRMLQVNRRPEWRTVSGGSQQYVKALSASLTGELRTGCAVRRVRRSANHVWIDSDVDTQRFDHVFMACHSDQALALLQHPDPMEQSVLGAIKYTANTADLHTDARLLPKNRNAWASWSVNRHSENSPHCTVNYYMNRLQNLDCPEPLIVSLNQSEHIDPARVLKTRHYHHPVYTRDTLWAQQQREALQGRNRTHYCGAYWGWGFHEDGARSAVEAAQHFCRTALQLEMANVA